MSSPVRLPGAVVRVPGVPHGVDLQPTGAQYPVQLASQRSSSGVVNAMLNSMWLYAASTLASGSRLPDVVGGGVPVPSRARSSLRRPQLIEASVA